MGSSGENIAAAQFAAGKDEVRIDAVLALARRLDRLQIQMDGVNNELTDHLERALMRRRRRLANAELTRFRRQARKLAIYVPY